MSEVKDLNDDYIPWWVWVGGFVLIAGAMAMHLL